MKITRSGLTLALSLFRSADTPSVPSGCSEGVVTFATGPIIQGSPELWDNVLGVAGDKAVTVGLLRN